MPPDDAPAAPKPRRRQSNRQPGFFEQHKSAVINGLISLGVLAVAGFFGLVLMGLNREVGQLQQGTQDTSRQITELRATVTRSEDRLDRIRDRLDALLDRLFTNSRSKPKSNK